MTSNTTPQTVADHLPGHQRERGIASAKGRQAGTPRDRRQIAKRKTAARRPMDRLALEHLGKMMDRWEQEQIEIEKALDRELERLRQRGLVAK